MTYEEFCEKVGSVSKLVDDEEYQKILFDYQKSNLTKDEFLKEWREQKKQSIERE